MNAYDFRLNDAPDGFSVYPLTCRALAAIETARRMHYPAAFQWYATQPDELARLHGEGFTFC